MTLTLGNDLTGLVSRKVDAAESKARSLGASLTTGNDVFVEVVDEFLGNSLRDGEILLGAIAKNTTYGVNLLTVTNEYLKTIASLLRDSLKIISSAGSFSVDKLAVLQKNLNDKKAQVNLLINTASFDGKSLLKGNIMDMEIQVGLNVDDKLKIKVNDISNGKLFRSSITTALNEKIKSGNFPTNYYININEINAAADHNTNLFLRLSLLIIPGL
jgi:flagellin-like hook-associated protein FlgL